MLSGVPSAPCETHSSGEQKRNTTDCRLGCCLACCLACLHRAKNSEKRAIEPNKTNINDRQSQLLSRTALQRKGAAQLVSRPWQLRGGYVCPVDTVRMIHAHSESARKRCNRRTGERIHREVERIVHIYMASPIVSRPGKAAMNGRSTRHQIQVCLPNIKPETALPDCSGGYVVTTNSCCCYYYRAGSLIRWVDPIPPRGENYSCL